MSVATSPQGTRRELIEISLTDFVDFIIRHGTARVSKVRQLKYRPDYHPSRDFWKPIRDGIRDFHARGRTDRRELDHLVLGAGDVKAARFSAVLAAYKSWLGRKNIEWLPPLNATWVYRNLSVKVNPELGARINGSPKTLVKLYFKNETPPKQKVNVILQLMQVSIGSGWTSTLLDIPRKKPHTVSRQSRDAQLSLEGDADAFIRYWRGV